MEKLKMKKLGTLLCLGTILLATAACNTQPELSKGQAALGTEQKADSTDLADTSCEVILRSVQTSYGDDGYPATECDEQGCHHVLLVTVDVDAELEAPPVLLYHELGDSQWWEKEAEPKEPGGPGFMRYEVRIWEHLSDTDSIKPIELIPFTRTDGQRLFDHNVISDPLGCYYLGSTQGYLFPSETICTYRPMTSSLVFDNTWSEYPMGTLRAGEKVAIDYAPSRLPDCRATHNGYPAWGMYATIQFQPGGQSVSGSVVKFRNDQGRPLPEFYPVPLVVDIPDDAEEAILWFHNESGAGNSCDSWDSDFGANYHFEVRPPRDQDHCADRWEWNRDNWAKQTCKDYHIDANYDATNCEFFVDSFSDVQTGHYGIPEYWLESDLLVTPASGQVLSVGIYAEYFDRSDATFEHAWVHGWQVEAGRWRTGLNYVRTMHPYGGSTWDIKAFAFFLDQRRDDGSVARLWLSHSGQNYQWDDAFGIEPHRRYIPYGSAYDADAASLVFDSKWSCQ